ncbi:UvrD-helicase domain-containing protein [Paenibacillus filicis]|uniref:UvrD-helicase domain-containing protein n=1 Tax=Paenibacillus gyeongsangnamensis TaxID=3388067 RepID=A0ABT4QE95_9BACL|nr:RNA polymerase recycling motor HelD [Paenibacillus filicis]MCZ8515176.1 UvrD-helicase domain-containing protein [Paenibacillus filicis]
MSIAPKERDLELERIALVIRKLQERIADIEPSVGSLRDQVVDIRTHFWDDVTVNFSTEDDAVETYLSMKQQADLLSERERTHRHLSNQLKRMKRLVPSPYFGRIDFKEAGLPTEKVYIGVASFLEDDGETFLIYDWRTPIASLYYDYPPGPAEYDTPGGLVQGTMELKRQFVIRDGSLRFIFDTGVTIGDDLLQQVLSQGSDSQMKTIVATIQKEQNRIIRNDRSRMLIVQGAAGSGKTSAALQRVAYLLYKYRETLKADQMVLFSPNPMFNSYVSTVLPELGEENMQQTTFQEYLEHRLSRLFQLEDPFEQIEYLLTAEEEPGYVGRVSGIQYKASSAFLQVILNYKASLEREGMLFRNLRFRGRVLISKDRMKEQFYSYDSSIRLANRVILLQEWLRSELVALEAVERQADWVREEMDYLDTEQYQKAYNRARKRLKEQDPTFNDSVHEEEVLRKMIVQEQFKPLRIRIKQLRFVDAPALYGQLFERRELFEELAGPGGVPEHWDDVCSQTLERLSRKALAYEDATPYLYLQELVEGFRTNRIVRHVVIDEAQDFSAFQYEFIKRLFPRSRLTVLGDFNQAIFAHATSLVEDTPVARLFGEEETETIVLTRSYRSTLEIVEFTKAMLPGMQSIEPFQRTGGKPVVLIASSAEARIHRIVQDVQALQAEGMNSVAIICKTAAESQAAYEALMERLELRLITKDTATFERGIHVIPAYLAKGVEFDAVLLYDASDKTYRRENERKLFYTACTRAMHRLRLYAVGELSPFVRVVDPGLFVKEEIGRSIYA